MGEIVVMTMSRVCVVGFGGLRRSGDYEECLKVNPEGLIWLVVSPLRARRWSMLSEYGRRMCRRAKRGILVAAFSANLPRSVEI